MTVEERPHSECCLEEENRIILHPFDGRSGFVIKFCVVCGRRQFELIADDGSRN